MTTPRLHRFAVAAGRVDSAQEWLDLAREVESMGYATLLLPDHANPQLAPIPALTAAALVTSSLRVGTQVLDNDHRNPVILAKEIATIDLLSGGRFDWGMGAGWLPSDYEATGIPFDPPGDRLTRLKESVSIIQGILGGGPHSHDGRHYTVTGAKGAPMPVQQPHPPLLIGGSKEHILRWAGQVAQIVSISPHPQSRQFGPYPPSISVVESMDRQVGWISEGVAGRSSDDGPELSLVLNPRITVDRVGVLAKLAEGAGLSADEAEHSPHIAAGSVDEVAGQLEARRDRWGLCNWVVPAPFAKQMAPVVEALTGT